MKTKINSNRSIFLIVVTFIIFIIPEFAQAQAGHMHRATRRRTAVVVSTATHEKDAAAAAAAQPAPAPAPVAVAAPVAATSALPIGTIVTVLPAGSVTLDINNVKYYQSGPNYYMAAYQNNTLVYITANLPK